MTQAAYPTASAQEVFDAVARHLLTQREPSFANFTADGKPICLYRGPHGLKCAVGVLIPDELYRASLETLRVEVLPEREPKFKWMYEHMKLLHQLQALHDTRACEFWPADLAAIAEVYGLSADVLKEFPNG